MRNPAIIIIILIPLFLLIMLPSVPALAENKTIAPAVAYAHVYVYIINNPPKILDLSFAPAIAYSDSIVSCIPTVQDEAPEYVTYNFRWYRNGELIPAQTKSTLSGFGENDQITCEAVPIDSANQSGAAFSKSLTIQKTPLMAKAELLAFSAMGAKADTEKVLELNQQGLTAVTGYVISESGSGSQLPVFGLLFALLLLLLLVDINIFMRFRIKRRNMQKF